MKLIIAPTAPQLEGDKPNTASGAGQNGEGAGQFDALLALVASQATQASAKAPAAPQHGKVTDLPFQPATAPNASGLTKGVDASSGAFAEPQLNIAALSYPRSVHTPPSAPSFANSAEALPLQGFTAVSEAEGKALLESLPLPLPGVQQGPTTAPTQHPSAGAFPALAAEPTAAQLELPSSGAAFAVQSAGRPIASSVEGALAQGSRSRTSQAALAPTPAASLSSALAADGSSPVHEVPTAAAQPAWPANVSVQVVATGSSGAAQVAVDRPASAVPPMNGPQHAAPAAAPAKALAAPAPASAAPVTPPVAPSSSPVTPHPASVPNPTPALAHAPVPNAAPAPAHAPTPPEASPAYQAGSEASVVLPAAQQTPGGGASKGAAPGRQPADAASVSKADTGAAKSDLTHQTAQQTTSTVATAKTQPTAQTALAGVGQAASSSTHGSELQSAEQSKPSTQLVPSGSAQKTLAHAANTQPKTAKSGKEELTSKSDDKGQQKTQREAQNGEPSDHPAQTPLSDARLMMQPSAAAPAPLAAPAPTSVKSVNSAAAANTVNGSRSVARAVQPADLNVQAEPTIHHDTQFVLPALEADDASLSDAWRAKPAASAQDLTVQQDLKVAQVSDLTVAASAAAAPAKRAAEPALQVAIAQVTQPAAQTAAAAPVAGDESSPVEADAAQAELQDGAVLDERRDAQELKAEDTSEARSEGRAGGEQTSEQGAGQGQSRGFSDSRQEGRFQASDAQGARGIEAVVASLLKSQGDGKHIATGDHTARQGVRSTLLATPATHVDAKQAEAARVAQLAMESQGARLREEERSVERVEGLSVEPMLLTHHEQLPATKAAEAPATAAPMFEVPLPAPDPDAAAMGDLQRGDGVQKANVSIDHPELGAMDLMVQHENGRVDVRAVLQSPRAAAAMRAQESALRTGIQQAGMTLGALRVRARTGDGTTVKAPATVRRRRGNDWEA